MGTEQKKRCGNCFWFTGDECEHHALNGVREVDEDSYLGEGCLEEWWEPRDWSRKVKADD
jgi:hypothetical protein